MRICNEHLKRHNKNASDKVCEARSDATKRKEAESLYQIPLSKERRYFMYNDLRMDLICRLNDAGVSADQIGMLLGHLDDVATGYTITKASTELTVRGRDDLENYAKLYIVCKKIEGCKEATIDNYGHHIRAFVNYCSVPLEEIDANCIRKFLLLYKMDHDISDRSLDHIRQDINNWFLWLQNEGYITRNPCANVARIKYTVERKPALTMNELEHLRDVCRSDRERALVEALYATGCRISEALSIKVNDIFKACDNLGKIKEHIDNLFNAKRIKLSSSKNKEIIYCEFRAFNISGEEQFKIPTERKMTNEKEQMLLKLYSIQKEKLKILKDIEKYLKGNKNINKMELENIMKGVKGQ